MGIIFFNRAWFFLILKDEDGHYLVFAFSSQLGMAIYPTSNLPYYRMYYGKTYFRIFDIYDFNTMYKQLIQFLDPINNTQIFKVYIEGLVIDRNLE